MLQVEMIDNYLAKFRTGPRVPLGPIFLFRIFQEDSIFGFTKV